MEGERQRIESALRESEKKYKQVVENAAEVIYTTDAKGNFTYGNSAGLKITGYYLEELQRLNYLETAWFLSIGKRLPIIMSDSSVKDGQRAI